VQDPSPSLARRIGLKKGEERFRTHRDEEDTWDDRRNKNLELIIPSLGRGWDRLPKVAQRVR
jgi:hypothetical protein